MMGGGWWELSLSKVLFKSAIKQAQLLEDSLMGCWLTFQSDHEKEFAEISDFIEGHPFFCHMPNKLKKLLEMSLRRETFIFDTVLIKQGEPVQGLHFILK